MRSPPVSVLLNRDRDVLEAPKTIPEEDWGTHPREAPRRSFTTAEEDPKHSQRGERDTWQNPEGPDRSFQGSSLSHTWRRRPIPRAGRCEPVRDTQQGAHWRLSGQAFPWELVV